MMNSRSKLISDTWPYNNSELLLLFSLHLSHHHHHFFTIYFSGSFWWQSLEKYINSRWLLYNNLFFSNLSPMSFQSQNLNQLFLFFFFVKLCLCGWVENESYFGQFLLVITKRKGANEKLVSDWVFVWGDFVCYYCCSSSVCLCNGNVCICAFCKPESEVPKWKQATQGGKKDEYVDSLYKECMLCRCVCMNAKEEK